MKNDFEKLLEDVMNLREAGTLQDIERIIDQSSPSEIYKKTEKAVKAYMQSEITRLEKISDVRFRRIVRGSAGPGGRSSGLRSVFKANSKNSQGIRREHLSSYKKFLPGTQGFSVRLGWSIYYSADTDDDVTEGVIWADF